MTDAEIARELERRELQPEYLHALAALLGVALSRAGDDPRVLEAIEAAPLEVRRRAALQVLGE